MCSAIIVLKYYLPTYYQTIRGYTPSKSGYMMIPIIVGSSIGMLLSGIGTSALGYYTPFMLFSSILMPIFAGLITNFKVNTSFAWLILYSSPPALRAVLAFRARKQPCKRSYLPTTPRWACLLCCLRNISAPLYALRSHSFFARIVSRRIWIVCCRS
jgi:hypothetical protein